jgi:hypothetical protein
MAFFRNLRARMRRRKRIRAAMIGTNPLRQFVYLDEVSVYSLLASREGALPAEYTATETTSATGGSSSSIGLSQTNVSAKTESTRTQSFQVLRKSSVQAAFKDLREIENEKLSIAPAEQDSSTPRVARWSDIEKGAGSPQFDGLIIDPDQLKRGDLIEMEVELQAAPLYRFGSIVSAFQGLFEGGRKFFDASIYSNFDQTKFMGDMLTKLMVGLIPVECRAADYKVTEVNGKKQIIHRSLLDQVDPASLPQCEDLYVTGVAEEASFWKDIRGVLFSGATYYVMCRLNHGGLRSSWNSVKLVDVLRDMVPDMDERIAELEMIPRKAPAATIPASSESARLLDAAVTFGESLAANYGISIPHEELADEFRDVLKVDPDFTDVDVRREFFDALKEIIQARLPEVPSAELIASLRESAVLHAGFDLDGTVVVGHQPQAASSPIISSPRSIIDTEIIAIYW